MEDIMLIQCSECELQVSNLAEFCPHCGCPVLHEENDGKNKRNKRSRRSLFGDRRLRFYGVRYGRVFTASVG